MTATEALRPIMVCPLGSLPMGVTRTEAESLLLKAKSLEEAVGRTVIARHHTRKAQGVGRDITLQTDLFLQGAELPRDEIRRLRTSLEGDEPSLVVPSILRDVTAVMIHLCHLLEDTSGSRHPLGAIRHCYEGETTAEIEPDPKLDHERVYFDVGEIPAALAIFSGLDLLPGIKKHLLGTGGRIGTMPCTVDRPFDSIGLGVKTALDLWIRPDRIEQVVRHPLRPTLSVNFEGARLTGWGWEHLQRPPPLVP